MIKFKNLINKIFKIGIDNDERREGWLKRKLESLPAGRRILDAGAGECRFKKFCSHLNYAAQDFGKYDGSGDNKGLQMDVWGQSCIDIISDICKIPESDESFDAILCTEVFEHIPDPISAIKEFSRLLKKEGILIITAPFISGTHFSPYHFYSGFNRYFYERYLKENNFEIIEIVPNGNFFDFVAQEIRRAPFMVKKYVKKLKVLAYALYLLEIPILLILSILSKFGSKSSEFLNYGFFILAKRK